ncbi:hypothetical protein HK413_05230 [Mucilaginibacter sp. S1162]|uniref:Uncharacterized protein n=2 Tax=Mucilaginibacter humi TaxID=2732510 RepID=A0ABX1W176_9SPHI|nr:hypothetical protein [Mucilaginibacter humi]
MERDSIELERIRIWDFYLTFPNEARKIKFPMQLAELKKIFKDKAANPYEDLIDPRRILQRMQSFQMAALRCPASYGLIDGELLIKKMVKRTDKPIPDAIKVNFQKNSPERDNIIKLVIGFADLPLYGAVGLKERSGLLDFKYDPR